MFYSDHDFEGRRGEGCTATLYRRNPESGLRDDPYPCNAPESSVLHPPDQFRHWCAALEAGGDCGHEG